MAVRRPSDDGNRLLRMLIALTAGIVMGALSTFVSEKASAAPAPAATVHAPNHYASLTLH